MEKKKIRKQLKESNISGTNLEDLTAILHKYYHPEEYSIYTESKINKTGNDYLELVKYMYRRYKNKNKTPSIPSIKQKISYLSNFDVELEEDYIKELFSSKGEVEEIASERGLEGNSYANFRYHSYLAVRTYLKAKGREDLANLLPDTEEIGKPDTNPRTSHLTKEEVRQLLEETDDEDAELIILLGFYCGLRIQEILQLKVDWIKFPPEEEEYGYIELPKWVTKEDEEQKVYFGEKLFKHLKRKLEEIEQLQVDEKEEIILLNLQDDEILKGRKAEIRVEEERIEAIDLLNEIVDEMADKDRIDEKQTDDNLREFKHGGRDLTPHVLRHSFLRYIRDSTDLKLERVKEQARHSSIETTMIYLEEGDKEKKEDYKKAF